MSSQRVAGAAAPLDVGRLLDRAPWSRYQQLVIALAALTVIFDGADIQLLGVSVPAIAIDWHVPRGAFAPVLAIGLIGMMIGGALGGLVGDRFGRRTALVGSLLVFGTLTLAAATVNSLFALAALRFFAGVGFGGTVPNAAALTSELAPMRHRAFAVSLTIVCIPLGGTLGALLAGQVIPAYGWRALFVIVGALPLTVASILLAVMPESPRYLAGDLRRWPELARLLRRAGHEVDPDAAFAESSERAAARSPIAALFSGDLRRDTIALWLAFISCLLAVYIGFNWLPSLLTGAGLSVATASTGLAAFNLGGVAGAIGGALVIARLGSKPTMLAMAAGAIAGALALSTMRIDATRAAAIVTMLGVTGGLINALQTTMYALAAHVYPTPARATGVGSAAAVGRLGAILSSYAGNWALELGGTRLFFAVMAGAVTVSMASLAIIRRHIPRTLHPAPRTSNP